jgi:Ala-tRNA(Pro) deacylase
MSLNKKVRQLLHECGADYRVLSHEEAFSSQELAAEADVSGWRVAKVLVLRAGNGTYRMLVLPAPAHLDLGRYREETGDYDFDLADEGELSRLFPDCEVGAMPPFGNLYGIPVWVDSCMTRSGEFYFPAGNHHQVVRMLYEDFDRIVRPAIGELCETHQPSPLGA